MRTIKQLIAAVGTVALDDGTLVPWSNGDFADGEEPAPPYVVLEPDVSQTAFADNVVWAAGMGYTVSLFTATRDYALERTMQAALDDAEIAYEKQIITHNDESLIEAAYDVVVED